MLLMKMWKPQWKTLMKRKLVCQYGSSKEARTLWQPDDRRVPALEPCLDLGCRGVSPFFPKCSFFPSCKMRWASRVPHLEGVQSSLQQARSKKALLLLRELRAGDRTFHPWSPWAVGYSGEFTAQQTWSGSAVAPSWELQRELKNY